MNTPNTTERLVRARESLEGLSVGDAIGESLSYQYYRCRENCDFSAFRPGTVRYTDDTEMALAIVETLQRLGGIDEDVVAWAFSTRYRHDPDRGYGKMARRVLEEIQNLGCYREALLSTLEVGGDCDTNCAIVGGVVSAYSAACGIPEDWHAAREAIAIKS
jgi:ADP-ribosylglycohydrolase